MLCLAFNIKSHQKKYFFKGKTEKETGTEILHLLQPFFLSLYFSEQPYSPLRFLYLSTPLPPISSHLGFPSPQKSPVKLKE